MIKHDWKRSFFVVWAGQSLSLIGSSLAQFSIIWWLTKTSGKAGVLAMASMVGLMPAVVLAPFVGALVDRRRRRWILIVSDGSIAFLSLILAFLFHLGSINTPVIYVFLFGRALGAAFHEPSMVASTTLMVPRAHLARIAGINQARESVSLMGGPVLGAILISTIPMQVILLVDTATALLAIIPLIFIDIPQPSSGRAAINGGQASRGSFWQDSLDGFRLLARWRGLLALTLTTALVPVFGMPAVSLVPLLISNHFGGGPLQWSWYSLADQIGILASGVILGITAARVRRYHTLLAAGAAFGLFSIVQGIAPGDAFWLFLSGTFMAGLSASTYFATIRVLVQTAVPPAAQGRVISLQNALVMAAGPIGLAIVGPLADVVGVQTPFFLRGVAALFAALVWVLNKHVRNLENTTLSM